jgi:NTE family protein
LYVTDRPPPSRVAFVLAGGAARGAYEVGILSYVFTDVVRALGRKISLDILCGTSVGAINACALAASADDPSLAVDRLVREWTALRLPTLVRANTREILALIRSFIAPHHVPVRPGQVRQGGVLDPTGIERIVHAAIDFPKIRDHLRAGRLRALTISTTDVATGKTVIFLERSEPGQPRWSRDPTIAVRATEIQAEHALASAAVPFLFPAVRIDDAFYCDGGLRQNVPLSPARRLGADGLLVVNPRYIGAPTPKLKKENEASYPGPLFLAGKALNALLLDRIDNDISRLRRINDILEAGMRRYGPSFVDELNAELAVGSRVSDVRPLRVVHIRASADIGAAAGAYVRSPEFAARAGAVAGKVLRRMAEWEGEGEADLVSYLLFDGEFAARLIELGRRDAASRHEELCALFEARVETVHRS